MKTRIVPSINAKNFEEIKEKINILKDLVNHFHLDVANFKSTNHETWQNPKDLDRIEAGIKVDLHLMIPLEPLEILRWIKSNVRRLILHLEFSSNPNGLLRIARKTRREVFLAWSPKIKFDIINRYLDYIDGVLILGVNPGRPGQEILPGTLERISFIKNNIKNKHKIIVDGGINKKNIQDIIKLRVDFIVMASAIYNSPDPREEYLSFLNIIKDNLKYLDD